MYVKRFLTAWIGTAAFVLAVCEGDFFMKVFAESFPIYAVAAVAALIFAVLTLIVKFFPALLSDDRALILSVLIYAYMLTWRKPDFIVGIGITAVVIITLIYMLDGDRLGLSRLRFPWTAAIIAAAVCGAFFGVFTGLLTSLRYLTYSTPNFDFGIFVNMFHNMKQTLRPLVTCERDRLLSHFAVHISPVYYLILPFYCLFPSPITLNIAQSVILASGVIPLFLLAKNRGLSPKCTAALCAAFAFFPAMAGGCFYDIHENCFLTPLLLWMFYFLERDKYAGVYIFALLTLTVKEDAAVYVAFAALYMLLSEKSELNRKKRFLHGGTLLVISCAYFAFAAYVLDRYGTGIMESRYGNFVLSGEGLITMIRNVVRNPGLVFSESFDTERIIYLLQMLVPLAFLPLCTRKPARFLLLLPMLLINLMPDYYYQHTISYQYNFGTLAFLFFAAALNLSDFKPEARRSFAACALVASTLLFNSSVMEKRYYIGKYKDCAYEFQELDRVIELVPDDVSVQASTFLLPHVAARSEIYEFPSLNDTEYILIDLRFEQDTAIDTLIELYGADGYDIIEYSEGYAMLLRRAEKVG